MHGLVQSIELLREGRDQTVGFHTHNAVIAARAALTVRKQSLKNMNQKHCIMCIVQFYIVQCAMSYLHRNIRHKIDKTIYDSGYVLLVLFGVLH